MSSSTPHLYPKNSVFGTFAVQFQAPAQFQAQFRRPEDVKLSLDAQQKQALNAQQAVKQQVVDTQQVLNAKQALNAQQAVKQKSPAQFQALGVQHAQQVVQRKLSTGAWTKEEDEHIEKCQRDSTQYPTIFRRVYFKYLYPYLIHVT